MKGLNHRTFLFMEGIRNQDHEHRPPPVENMDSKISHHEGKGM